MKKYISKFHYLTLDMPGHSHASQALIACSAGANWIRYRCMTKTEDELIDEINEIAEICDDWGATLIITNHYDLLDRVDAQGVHIEDADADLVTIRKIIGEDKTLGASANNLPHLLKIQDLGVVDYVGYGPFASTDSKSDDTPVLGYNGYRQLERSLVEIPVIVVGGIKLSDVEHLKQTGIYGITISATIDPSPDPVQEVKEFYKKMY